MAVLKKHALLLGLLAYNLTAHYTHEVCESLRILKQILTYLGNTNDVGILSGSVCKISIV